MQMDEETQHLRSYLFTVRIWLEQTSGSQMGWHGKAQSILTGEICYFQDWLTLFAFLKKNLPEIKGDFDHEQDRQEPSP